MKKKILLTVAITIALMCLIVMGVSAEKINGIEYTLNPSNKTATFAASNRTECTLTRVVIPETVVGADGVTYTVTAIADRSIGHQDANAGNKYIEYLYIPKTVTSLGAQLVRNCYALKEVKIDASVTKLSAGDFWSCSNLEILDLSGMKNLTTLDQITSATPKLKTVKLPNTVTTIGGKAFQSCSSLTTIVFPSGLTSIGSNTFQSTKISTLVLPSTLSSVGGAAFHSISAVQTLVFANTSFDGWSTNVTFSGVNPNIIFFAGSNPATLTNHYTQWASYKTMTYTDYLANPSAATAKTIVYGTENCACGYIRTNEEPTFNFTSYTEKMTVSKTCSHCQKETVLKSIDPMFVFLGFSCAQYGDMMSVNYRVNEASISEYEKITGETVNYGIFAVTKDNIGTNDIFDENGKSRKGVIAADLTGSGFNLVNLKVFGFTTEQKDIDLAIGAFIGATKDKATKYTYLQIEEPSEGAKYFFASYNDVAELVPSDDEENA